MTTTPDLTREKLIELLNEDLSREYQAIIAYVIYSQVLKGAQYMSIAKELEVHAGQELEHAITVSKHIDYLGGTPTSKVLPVKFSEKPEELLRADLDNENATIIAYRERVRQCEALGDTRSPKTFAKSSARSRSTRRIWRPHSERMRPTFPRWENRSTDLFNAIRCRWRFRPGA